KRSSSWVPRRSDSEVVNMTPMAAVVFAGVLSLAAVLKGAFGFGFASVAVPALSLVMDPRDVIQIMVLPTLLGDVLGALTAQNPLKMNRSSWVLVGAAVAAALPSAAMISWLPERIVALTVGVVTV